MDAALAPHPNDQILHAYGLGKLVDPRIAAVVDSHLEGCEACRQRVSELSGDSFVGRIRNAGERPDAPSGSAAPDLSPAGGPKDPAPDPALARTLPPELAENSQYQVLRELGRGGMGVVYLARNTMMDRLEVLKVLNKEMLERKGTYDRFLREVRAAARLNHAHVVCAYSALQIGRLLVFAMEYVDGADLSQLVKTKGPLPVAPACLFAWQAAQGLQHAHERGMVHRDIKPGNLMLMRQGQRGIVKILDFGLAKATSENPLDGGLTHEGQMLGTPLYIAPEQTLDAQKADIRADIYSLGCTLYYLLTGGPPFDGKSLYDILQAHHSVEARPLNLARPEVPVELAMVVARMMAKDKELRYQTPAEVAEALKPFFKKGAEKPAEPVRPPAPETNQPAPPDPVHTPKKPEDMWQSLIDFKADSASPQSAPQPAGAGPRRSRGLWLAAAAACSAFVLGLIIYVATDRGRVRIVVDDPKAVVKVDGEELHIEGLGEPITLRAGAHELGVRRGNGEFKIRTFIIRRGDNENLKVEYEPIGAPRASASREPAKAPEPAPMPTAAADSTVPLKEAIPSREPAKAPEAAPVPTVVADSTVPAKVITKSSSKKSLAGRRTGRGGESPKLITNTIGMKLVLIPAGEFLMGAADSDPEGRDLEKPQHLVRITRPFYLGATEVTQGQYRSVTGANPSLFDGSDDLPVDSVSWNDAIAFCNRLNALEKGQLGSATYRLPSEAEWEYACRAGSVTRYSFGDDAARLGEFAWYNGNSGNRTHPVGQKPPNRFGLYDMHGNVWEWCWDGFDEKFYGQSPGVDPLGPSQAALRPSRGGSVWFSPVGARSANRGGLVPDFRRQSLGFRLARVQSSP